MSDVRVAAVLSLMASACASSPQIGDEVPQFACGSDASGWILSGPPENADVYRRLAAASPNFRTDKISEGEWGQHDRETWITKPSGEVILCLADGAPWEAWSTSFWRFTAPVYSSGQPEVAGQAATIIIG